MRAVIVEDFGKKPEVRDVPRPSPAAHEVLAGKVPARIVFKFAAA